MKFTSTTTSVSISYLQPEAYITTNKNRVKVYSSASESNIFFKDNTNFEIELFNPTFTRYMAKIWINDKLISTSGIVVNAGQRVYIERFIDTPNKFLFETFKVDDVKETTKAREKNGKVKIQFYSEQTKGRTLLYEGGPSINNIFYSNSGGLVGTSTPTFAGYSSGTSNFDITSDTNSRRISLTSMDSLSLHSQPKQTETGRVGQGDKSEQEFKSTTGDFYEYPSYLYEYHLLPESLKGIEPEDIRHYCPECGTRQKKSSWKYCPNCGTQL